MNITVPNTNTLDVCVPNSIRQILLDVKNPANLNTMVGDTNIPFVVDGSNATYVNSVPPNYMGICTSACKMLRVSASSWL